MRVLAADPGGTTGWAYYADGAVTAGQDEFASFTDIVDGWCSVHSTDPKRKGVPDVIVAERFLITPQTAKLSQQSTALEIIGFLRYVAHREGIPFVLQTPADAKRFAQVGSDKDARLERVGWLKKPKAQNDHANDALRHLLLYTVKNKIIEVPR